MAHFGFQGKQYPIFRCFSNEKYRFDIESQAVDDRFMSQTLSLDHISCQGKKVLLRDDFNVPLDDEGHITDDSRIQAALPTIRYLLDHGAALIIMSHLGRPKGVPNPKYSLAPIAKRLSALLNRPVQMAPDCIGEPTAAMAHALKPGELLLLENLRFHPFEEHPEKGPDAVRQLASLGDAYVNDAFGTAHRQHASTAMVASYFPDQKAPGFLLEKEISFLGDALKNPARPFYALIGGAKISTKLGVLKALLERVDGLYVAGGMAYTFLKAQGIPIGESIYEEGCLADAKILMDLSQKKNKRFFLPLDLVIADRFAREAKTKIVSTKEGIPSGWQGMDIGPKTVQALENEMMKAQTILWNGPLGVYEFPAFAKGTNAIAHALSQIEATTIIGGGDSVAAIRAEGLADHFNHLSTGGGATLEYIEKGTLPGIIALAK